MMQEEELVIKDHCSDSRHNHSVNQDFNNAQDIMPFTISDGIYDDTGRNYSITLFEIFVTAVITLCTISGGYLEGYMSPALPSLLKPHKMLNEGSKFLFDNSTQNNSDGPIHIKVNDNISNAYFEFDKVSEVPMNNLNSSDANISYATTSAFTLTNKSSDTKSLGHSADKISDDNEPYLDELKTVTNTMAHMTEAITESVEALQLNETTQGTFYSSEFNDSSTDIPNILPTSLSLSDSSSDLPELLPTPLPLTDIKELLENAADILYITEEEGSWLGSLLLLGAAFGAAVSPWVIKFGRRHAIIASGAPRLLGWLLTIFSTSVYTFYVGRFICGVSIGAISAAVSIYMSEVAHPSLRGTLSCIIILGVNFGMFIAAFLGTFLGWKGLSIMGALSVVAYCVPSFCIPNSPSWLALQGREGEARVSLRNLRRKGWGIEEELQQVLTIAEKVSRNKSISWKALFLEKRCVLPLVVVTLVTVVNRFSGYNAIITYCSVFIREAVPSASEYWSNVAVCLVQIFATIGAMTLVDSWGRRKLLLLSVTVMGVALISVAICEGIVPIRQGGTWVAVLATMVYVSSYSLGIGPLTWVLMGELFPLDARDKASALVSVLNWLLAFVVTKTYFSLESSVGIIGICLVYASVCLVGGVTLFLLVPETKGKSLAEIEAYFSYPQKGFFLSGVKFDRRLSSILDQEAATIDTYSTFH